MANLKVLLILRYIFIFCSATFAAACFAFAIKALLEVKEDRKLVDKTSSGLGVLHVDDMLAVTIVCVVAGAFGAGASLISEGFLYVERRRGLAAGKRIMNECILGFTALFLLGSSIAGTIVGQRKALITMNGLDQKTIMSIADPVLKEHGKSLAYKSTWAWKSVIMAWCTFATVTITLILVLMAGLHYRREAKRNAQGGFPHANRNDSNDSEVEKHAADHGVHA